MKLWSVLVNYSIVLSVALFLFSCGQEVEIQEVDLNDILPSSEKYSEENLKDSTRIFEMPKHSHDSITELDKVLFENFPQYTANTNLNPKRYFPDRLRPEGKVSKVLSVDSTLIDLEIWSFKDSVQTENAFFNWLDCFGNDCKSIRVGEQFKSRETTNCIYVSEKFLIYVYSNNKIDGSVISKMLSDTYGEDWKYIVQQQVGRRAKWLVLPTDVETTEL